MVQFKAAQPWWALSSGKSLRERSGSTPEIPPTILPMGWGWGVVSENQQKVWKYKYTI